MCDWDAGSAEGKPYALEVGDLQRQNRVLDIPLNDGALIGTTWDDGRGTTAVWIYGLMQGSVAILGFKEWHNCDLVSVAKKLNTWYADNNFFYGVHCLPHTMEERSYNLESQISRRHQLKKLFNYQGQYLPIKKVTSLESKFQAGKELLKHCVFSRLNYLTGEPMEAALTKLKRYSRVRMTNSKSVDAVYTSQVAKNAYSHAGDAFGELALGVKAQQVQALNSQIVLNKRVFTPVYRNKIVKVLRPY